MPDPSSLAQNTAASGKATAALHVHKSLEAHHRDDQQ
jgi:hypothetical protein